MPILAKDVTLKIFKTVQDVVFQEPFEIKYTED
jgi:hypothetical protein